MQAWPRPSRPLPIVVIGAGAIVRTAHLPAYRALGFPVAGLFDIRLDAARAAAEAFAVENVFPSLAAAAAVPGVVYDIAVPGDQILGILDRLPRGAAVLMQKPMGQDLASAKAIRACCRERQLTAAVNFQLRFSPNVLALRDLLTRGTIGPILDIDVRVVIDQPWHRWTFLETTPRLEVPYHSIHYLDTIRWLAGEPDGVYCRVVRHPALPALADTRSSIILDYGDRIRCSLALNHTHRAGPRYRASQPACSRPCSSPSKPRYRHTCGGDWRTFALRGSWFIDAFEGPMSNLQRFVSGEDSVLVGSVDDAIRTMAVVEACYISSAGGGTPVPASE